MTLLPRAALLPLCLLLALPTLADAKGFDVRDLASIDRHSSPTLSPDGRKLVFAKRTIDEKLEKATTGLWIEDLVARDAAPPVRLTPDGWNVNSPAFSPDGRTVYFLSGKGGTQQLYGIPVAGGTPRQVTGFALDVGSYQLSPDGTRVAFSADTFGECGADLACTKKRWTTGRRRRPAAWSTTSCSCATGILERRPPQPPFVANLPRRQGQAGEHCDGCECDSGRRRAVESPSVAPRITPGPRTAGAWSPASVSPAAASHGPQLRPVPPGCRRQHGPVNLTAANRHGMQARCSAPTAARCSTGR